MDDMKQLRTVEGKRVYEEIRERMTSVEAPVACGIGFVNYIQQVTLVDPLFYTEKGTSLFEPSSQIHHGEGSISMFVNKEDKAVETCGCLTYCVNGSKVFFAVLWNIGPNGNRFNARCLHQKLSCDKELYDQLNEGSVASSETLLRDENGFRLQAIMTKDSKATLIIECSSLIAPYKKTKGDVVSAGDLPRECEKNMKEFQGHNCCVVGIENSLTGNHLGNPQTLEETGLLMADPSDVLEPGMGVCVTFSKREFALKGTSACLSYDIGDTNSMVVARFEVPPHDMQGENRFNVRIMERKPLSRELSKELEGDWVSSRQGKLIRTDGQFKAEGTLTEGEKCILYLKAYTKS